MDTNQKGLNLDKFKKPNPGGIQSKPHSSASTAPKIPWFVEIEKRKANVIASIDNIPSLPTVIVEIMRIANSKTSSASDIEAKMKADQVLTAKILKVANSSYYALNTKVTTITRAVATLGFSSVKNILMATSVSNTLNQDLKIYGYGKGGLWAHSLACAAIAKLIGSKVYHLDDEQTEELFIGGLLHDIGKIVIAPELEKYKQELKKYQVDESFILIEKAEENILGISHPEVGKILCSKWNLSEDLQNAVGNHHLETPDKFSSIIKIADILCHENMIGLSDEFKWLQKLSPELLNTLGITETSLIKLQEFFKDYIRNEIADLILSMKIA
jgi:HD-like signal output (HDOD) protein